MEEIIAALREAKHLVMGEITLGQYLAAFFFSALGQIISIRLHAENRDVLSQRTPVLWSWKFFITDNLKRFTTGMVFMFIMFRFFGEITGRTFGMFWAMLIGFGLAFGADKLVLQQLKEKFPWWNAKPKDQ